MPAAEAARLLGSCCGASRWVQEMLGRRPFGDVATVLSAAELVWDIMEEPDWREAFAHHPRIGERGEGVAAAEQAGMDSADPRLRAEMAQVNRDYEARFGYIYIVCASGRSAEELLALARARLGNDPRTELRTATREQEKIMLLRLERLLT